MSVFLTSLREDRAFWSRLFVLVLPIMGQSFIQNALGAVDVFMVGQLGETAVAGLGLADQMFFLLVLFLFGVGSGSAIFAAQAWGKQDMARIHHVLGIGLVLGVLGAAVFMFLSLVVPEQVMGLYTEDTAVVGVGASYLRIVGWSYLASAFTMVFAAVLRSTEQVRLPMFASLIALGLNSIFNYLLIFGKFGFPALGVPGAAVATAGARWLECILLLGVIYGRRLPIAASVGQMLAVRWDFVRSFMRTTAPVIATEVVWSFGQTVYSAFYARIGTESVAAVNIAVTIERLAFIVFISVASAASVMIGNRLGAEERENAYLYAKRFLLIQLSLAFVLGAALFAVSSAVPSLYNISATAAANTTLILRIMSVAVIIKSTNLMAFIGIIRAGGDTRMGLIMDIGPMWVIGVPLAYIGTFVFGLPVAAVYILALLEEVAKLGLVLWRIFSRRWMRVMA